MSVLWAALYVSALRSWLHRLGGAGLVLLGIADNSLIPLPGSMDVFTVLLSARNRDWWFYYAFMATVGAVLGGYLTYRLAEKGGEETLEKKIGKWRAEGIYQRFEKRGSFWVFLGAVLPPPTPIVPFLMAAGVLHHPKRKFLAALSAGRGLRYFALAYVGRSYGRAIIGFLSQYYRPVLYALITLAVLGASATLLYFKYYRPRRRREQQERGEPVEEFPFPGRANHEFERMHSKSGPKEEKKTA
jgi:membrane protein YqaA with SNARE-associated domain